MKFQKPKYRPISKFLLNFQLNLRIKLPFIINSKILKVYIIPSLVLKKKKFPPQLFSNFKNLVPPKSKVSATHIFLIYNPLNLLKIFS